MKLATWNLALPASASRCAALHSWTDRIAADVWVLTETHDDFNPGLPHSCSSAAGRDGTDSPEQRWVSIWSRHRLTPLATTDKQRTTAARVSPAKGKPFIVFGTVLPWLGSPWREHPAARGIAFAEALELQRYDWNTLRRRFPAGEFFVMGDFNQDLVSSHYYGSHLNRDGLRDVLNVSGLIALTGADRDPVRRDSPPCACIDHICARRDSRWHPRPAERWPDTPEPDRRLSDHFGVAVKFDHCA